MNKYDYICQNADESVKDQRNRDENMMLRENDNFKSHHKEIIQNYLIE